MRCHLRHCLALALDIFWCVGVRWLSVPTSAQSTQAPQVDSTSLQLRSIRSLLRRFPFWLRGHQHLGELSLSVDDVATAYAAAQCLVAATDPDTSSRGTAYLLLGQSFLRRGDWRTSMEYLGRAAALLPKDTRVAEERAAAHMAAGEHSHALKMLETIPSTRLTPAAKAALEFLRKEQRSLLS